MPTLPRAYEIPFAGLVDLTTNEDAAGRVAERAFLGRHCEEVAVLIGWV